jgi:two-component system chemotaxis sensor kinase CheA
MDSDSLQERLHSLFLEELDQHVEHLRQGLEHLAGSAPHVTRDVVEDVFRAAHSLKGAAQAVGAGTVARLCHDIEDTLSGVRDGTLQVGQGLLAGITRETDAIADAGAAFRLEHGREAEAKTSRSGPSGGSDVLIGGVDPRATDGAALTREEPATTVRLSPRKLDTLLAEAEHVVTSLYRMEGMVRAVADTRGRLTERDRGWRSDLRTLYRAVESSADPARATAALSRVEQHVRQVNDELGELSLSATAHYRGMRAAADRFAAAGRDVRRVPFSDATIGLNRLVREVCDRTGKKATLLFEAADVEIDKALAVTLRDVLGHLVRNAVDHGIEPPVERQLAGKAPEGTVRLAAMLLSQGIEVVVSDDGGGIRRERVRHVAEQTGVMAGAEQEVDLDELLFQPGFTTAQHASPSSGRGVGLDAVRTAVEAFGGSVRLKTEPGVGTQIYVSMPLTLSSLRVVLVAAAGTHVAVPSSAVRAIVRTPMDLANVDGRDVMGIDGETVVVRNVSDLLGWGNTEETTPRRDATCLVLEAGSDVAALAVDEVLAEREIVLRSLPERLVGLTLVLGTTQLEDGHIGLVLSPAACIRAASTRNTAPREALQAASDGGPTVLLAEDSLTTRELERGILELAGYTVLVAPDGAQAWQMLGEQDVDAVVSDVDMPRMDGVALCRAIRSSSSLADLPVILVTSLHSEEDRRRGLEAGANAYLPKSGFDRSELLEALERVL